MPKIKIIVRPNPVSWKKNECFKLRVYFSNIFIGTRFLTEYSPIINFLFFNPKSVRLFYLGKSWNMTISCISNSFTRRNSNVIIVLHPTLL